MTSLDGRTREVVRSASRLLNVLQLKTLRLPPAAREDLQDSLVAILRQLDRYSRSLQRASRSGQVADQEAGDLSGLAYAIVELAQYLEISLRRGRVAPPEVAGEMHESLPAMKLELDSYSVQIESRFSRNQTDAGYVESEAFPYRVKQFVPLRTAGFLAFVETSPHDLAPLAGQVSSEFAEASGEVAVEIYIDSEDESRIAKVIQSAQRLAEALGYEEVGEPDVYRGSIFRRSRAAAQVGMDELKSRLMKVERGLELAQLELRQAEVNSKESEAVSGILGSLEGVDRACIRVGSLLVIKYQLGGAPVVFVRSLNQLEMHALSRFPEIQTAPEAVLNSLAAAVATLADLEGDGDGTALTSGN